MSDDDLRALAFGVGYRMLGSRAEADDIAQEALLRAQPHIDSGEIDNPAAFTTTVATRLAIDELRSARRRRESYVGPWLPEPVVEWTDDPAETADALSFALLVVLDSLTPLERAAFLLREVFGFSYDDIAEAIGRSPATCRQLASRARRRVADHRPDPPRDRAEHRQLLQRFLAAASGADLDGLVELLADEVRLVSDGGARRRAARNPIVGRDRVARFLRSVFPRLAEGRELQLVTVNGEPGFAASDAGGTRLVGTVQAGGGRITSISWIVNPDKLPAPPSADASAADQAAAEHR